MNNLFQWLANKMGHSAATQTCPCAQCEAARRIYHAMAPRCFTYESDKDLKSFFQYLEVSPGDTIIVLSKNG
jgi:hypothetical protein